MPPSAWPVIASSFPWPAWNGSAYDAATVAYSNGGVPLWTNRYHGPAADQNDFGGPVAVDTGGNVFVAGSATIKYSGVGTPLWTNLVGSSDMAVDSNGNVFTTGSSPAANGFSDYVTIKYSGAG